MEHSYSVTVQGKQAGKVLVRRQGLYYHFSCMCRLQQNAMYRLMVHCGSTRESLGILVPQDGSFTLNTRLPVKRIGEGEMSFTLVPRRSEKTTVFVPICPEEPFAYISRLKSSFLVYQDGQPGICIEKKQEC